MMTGHQLSLQLSVGTQEHRKAGLSLRTVTEGVQVQCGVDGGWKVAPHIRYSYSPSQKPTQIHLIDQGWNHENFSNSLGMKILHSYGSGLLEGSSA